MNERAARAVLARLGDRAVMWRGPSLAGADVDLLVPDGQRAAVEAELTAAGLRRGDQWASEAGDVLVDLIGSDDWPGAYPDVDGVLRRARRDEPELPPVAAAEDRLLIFAADAVAGRPAAKLAAKLRPLAADAAAVGRARSLAREEGALGLLAIAADPDGLESAGRVLPYRRALAAAARSRRGRAALATRLRGSAARRLPQKTR